MRTVINGIEYPELRRDLYLSPIRRLDLTQPYGSTPSLRTHEAMDQPVTVEVYDDKGVLAYTVTGTTAGFSMRHGEIKEPLAKAQDLERLAVDIGEVIWAT